MAAVAAAVKSMSMAPSNLLVVRSGHARAVVIICVAVLVLVVLMHSLKWRDTRFEEGFEVVPQVNLAAARHPKSLAYVRAGLRHFFSDGVTNTSTQFFTDALFFMPSQNDIICRLGSASVQSACLPARSRIDAVSCRDHTTLIRSAVNCSTQVITSSKEPTQKEDCHVRVWEGRYAFNKLCMTLNQTLVTSNDKILLAHGQYTTKVMVLMRPMFLVGPLSRLYAIDYTKYLTGNDRNWLNFYDSDIPAPVAVHLTLVTDTTLVDPNEGIDLVKSSQLVRVDREAERNPQAPIAPPLSPSLNIPVALPTTLYYLNYMHREITPVAPYRVLTLYFRTPHSSQIDRDPGIHFSSSHLNVRATAGKQNGTVTAYTNNGGQGYQVPLIPDGLVVITYTTTLLMMTTFSPKRVVARRWKVPELRSISAAQYQSVVLTAPPPPEAYPYDNGCIPNLADLAIKMRML